MVDIAVVRTANSVIYDPRVTKIVTSLSKKYSVIALGWNRDGISQEKINDYIVKLDVFKLKTSVWKPSLVRIFTRLLIFFPLFWIWVFVKLLIYKPEIVHACDLDSILPCYVYKILFGKKLVFDIFDRYAMALIPPRFKKLYNVINCSEEFFCKHSDALIIAGGEKVLKTIQNKPRQFAVLMNCPQEHLIDEDRRNLKSRNDNFKLVYTGGIRADRALEHVAKAITKLNGVDFVLAGPIIDKNVLLDVQKSPNIKYFGLLPPVEALSLEASSDALVALYTPQILWNSITLPNKLFEAMMCGVPLITNVAHEIVQETACGIIVGYDNIEQIKNTIMQLRGDPDLRKKLGANGRRAFLEKYNWKIMEHKLYTIYECL